MGHLSETEAVIRIGVALLLGGLIGFERERREKSAGLKTYALVCEGAALFMIASLLLGEQARSEGNLAYDPSRIGSTIVQGIGFLAAGVIFTAGNRVHGLTTAAGIWVTAAVGLLVGSGLYVVAVAGTVATLVILVGLRWLERALYRGPVDEGLDDPSDQAVGIGASAAAGSCPPDPRAPAPRRPTVAASPR